MRPELSQQRDFLFQMYFGGTGGVLSRILSRAYRDMNRTLRLGTLENEKKELLYGRAKQLLNERLSDLLATKVATGGSLALFDEWQTHSCHLLIRRYTDAGVSLSFGQAQKWINMTLKYCWYFPDNAPPGFEPWFASAHVPIDEFILRALVSNGIVPHRPCVNWSRWDDPQAYMAVQTAVRSHAVAMKTIPLALESQWWLEFGALAER